MTDSIGIYTKSGPFLRKYSLDEIPQFLNIFLGELAFIGPRPALHNQQDLIKLRRAKDIHKLKPGITGWAQVNGRDSVSIDEKVRLDYFYFFKKVALFRSQNYIYDNFKSPDSERCKNLIF